MTKSQVHGLDEWPVEIMKEFEFQDQQIQRMQRSGTMEVEAHVD